MKKYKDLRLQLNEAENTEGGALGGYPAQSVRSATSDFGIHRIESTEQVQRIQAFLSAFTGREYLDPRAALSLMRVKINLAGLDFEFNGKTPINVGVVNYLKLTRFGGTFGTTPEHNLMKDGFKVTDGVEDTLDGDHLAIALGVEEAASGLYKITASVMRYSGDSPEQGQHTPAAIDTPLNASGFNNQK